MEQGNRRLCHGPANDPGSCWPDFASGGFEAQAAERIDHSDRGSQYCSRSYQRLMKQFKMQPSMAKATATTESFFGTLKNELVPHRKYRTRQEAIEEIREYDRSVLQSAEATCQLGQSLPGTILEKIDQSAGGLPKQLIWCPLFRIDT